MMIDSDEDGYETESDPTPILDETPTAGTTKRKREVSIRRICAPASSLRAEIIISQDYSFRIESKQKAEGIV